MTTITFPRPTKALLSMNDRHHWARKAKDVRSWRDAASIAARGFAWAYTKRGIALKEFKPSMVVITLDVPDKRRRDPANFFPCVKAIVDGLVDAGWWPDDTPEYVTVCEPVLRVVPPCGIKGCRVKELLVRVTLVPR